MYLPTEKLQVNAETKANDVAVEHEAEVVHVQTELQSLSQETKQNSDIHF